jgi:hypothetical protein
MISYLFAKQLNYNIDEKLCYDEIVSAPRKFWFTAKNKDDGKLQFVGDKEDCQFYVAKIAKFPNTLNEILKFIPDIMIKNSYVTKCAPGYSMEPHIDPNRETAIIIPLGSNKGDISFFYRGHKIYTYTYKGPTLTRVGVYHSATNPSATDYRYGITVEVPGSYLANCLKR